MPIIETDDGSDLFLVSVDLTVTAECSGETFLGLQSFPNLYVSATCAGHVLAAGESGTDMAVFGVCNGGLIGEPDIFGESEADLEVSGTCQGSTIQIGFSNNDLNITATCAGDVIDAEIFSWNPVIDLLPDSVSGKSKRRGRLLVDGVERLIKEADWIEDEGSIDPRLAVTLADPDDRQFITKFSVIEFAIGRKIAGVWVYLTMLEQGEVSGDSLAYGRTDGAPSDSFTFTGKTPLQVKFNRTPLRDLVLHDPQKVTVDSEDFDLKFDSNGNTYETEIVAINRMKMNNVFEEIFINRMGFDDWHSDLPDEFIPLSRVDFRAGVPYIEEIRGMVGFFSTDFQSIGAELWLKDGTVEHKSTVPVRQMTIRGAKLKELAVDTEYQRYDGVDLTYAERQVEYDFVTERVDSPPPSTVEVYGSTTSTDTSTTVYELRRNSQPEKIIDEKIKSVHQTVTIDGNLIEDRTDRRIYDIYGNQIRRNVEVNALVPSLVDGAFGMANVRSEVHFSNYRAHPVQRDKIFRYRDTQHISGLIVEDTVRPMFSRPVRQDMSTAFRGANLAPGQISYIGAIEHIDERVTVLTEDRVRIHRQRVDYITPFVANDFTEERAGSIALSTLINVPKQMYVYERGIYTRTGDKFLDLDAGEVPLRFAMPTSRRHLSMTRSLPKRVAATSIDFDETVIKGEDVNFRGRGGEDLGIYRIASRRFSMRRMSWTASYTARQVGVDDQYILVDAEDPHVPGNIVLRENDEQTVLVDFECRENYFLRCDPVADVLVEARLEGVGAFVNLETTPIDTTAFAATVQRFEIRFTTGALPAHVRREINIYLGL